MSGERARGSKNQRRLAAILTQIAEVREQLDVAIEDVGPAFTVEVLNRAATSTDPRERNKVAVIERELDVVINLMEELASRLDAEAVSRGSSERTGGRPWERLVESGAIPKAMADRLALAKTVRNTLAHVYPPRSWADTHASVGIVLDELDAYLAKIGRWTAKHDLL